MILQLTKNWKISMHSFFYSLILCLLFAASTVHADIDGNPYSDGRDPDYGDTDPHIGKDDKDRIICNDVTKFEHSVAILDSWVSKNCLRGKIHEDCFDKETLLGSKLRELDLARNRCR